MTSEISPTPLVDNLLPNETDPSLDEIAATTFAEGDIESSASAVDQMLMALVRRLLADSTTPKTLTIQLPRHAHRAALFLAVCSQLLCRRDAVLDGPVVLMGMDVNITRELRSLTVRNHRRMGLYSGNPLSVQRLARTGVIVPIVGNVDGDINRSLVYFNPRVGEPLLLSNPPLVIIDGTSLTNSDNRQRGLNWAARQGTRLTVLLGDTGDEQLIQAAEEFDRETASFAVTGTEIDALFNELGGKDPSVSNLSTMALLKTTPTTVRLHRVDSPEVNDLVTRCYELIGRKPPGQMPHEMETAAKLLRAGVRLAATTAQYRTACANNLRPGEGPRTLLRRLEHNTLRSTGDWARWATANWGALKVTVQKLWEAIETKNPKCMTLWRVLEDVSRNTTGLIAIRCHSRAAAEATFNYLSSDTSRNTAQQQLWDELSSRVQVVTMKPRYAVGGVHAQILTSAPPPWLFSLLLGVEANETHVISYDAEETALASQGARWSLQATERQKAFYETFSSLGARVLDSPVTRSDNTPLIKAHNAQLDVEALSITRILDSAANALDFRELQPGTSSTYVEYAGGPACIPIELSDGRTWWCVDEGDGSTPVLVSGAGGHVYKPVRDLKPGEQVIAPAGDGRESAHARLIAASHSNADVVSLDLLLSQFRKAARLVEQTSPNRATAIQRVIDAGGKARELDAWATGRTIAPREPDDVVAVFKAVGMEPPDLGLIYAVANSLRSLHRVMGKFVTVLATRTDDAALDDLRRLVGDAADEIVDEFMLVEVASVGESKIAPFGAAGKITNIR